LASAPLDLEKEGRTRQLGPGDIPTTTTHW
jgi:hypothetical protein